MLLDDVLKVVGTSELSDFPWGSSVVALVNSFTPEHLQLNLHSTGADLINAVGQVDEAHRPLLLQARVVVGLLGQQDVSANDDDPDIVTKHKTRSIISIGFTVVLCFIAIILTWSMSVSTIEHGKDPDTTGLLAVLKMIFAVISEL